MILLDTTACIDFLYGYKDMEPIIDELDDPIYITAITVYEVGIGLERALRKKSKARYDELKRNWLGFISGLQILHLGFKEAEKAAQIHDRLESKEIRIDDNDILIAGILLVNGIEKILTRNVKHFEKIEEITIVNY
jgi:predicted nucleic acid-binding protein